jgi:hypothetical protein
MPPVLKTSSKRKVLIYSADFPGVNNFSLALFQLSMWKRAREKLFTPGKSAL